ncbi:MAG: hypothetical protein M3Q30_05275 [Actinomycetota bacterium]|nr:hypothetical protein [Actinomycetota bacterium]
MSPEPTESAEMAFCVHGVSVRVICEPAAVAEALARRLHAFVVDTVADDAVLVTVTGPEAAPVISDETLDDARVVYEGPDGELRYFDVGDRLVADYARRVQIDVHPRAGWAHLAVTGRNPADLMLAAYPLFTVSLLEVLKRRGRFALHAACLARDGCGLLLAGASGSGKSTLAAALARDGFDFLGDDTVFLDATGRAVFAFPDELDVSDATVEMIPELSWLRRRAKRPGRQKHAVLADVLGGRTVLECMATALIFPRVARAADTFLEPIGPADALRELLPNVLLTEATGSQAHLDVLGRLAREVPAFRLSTGRVLAEAMETLAPLLRPGTQPRSISQTEPT